jgi:hypothetical protein
MFRMGERDVLRVPMGLFTDPEKDPVFVVKYITPAERQRILDSHTTRMFYPRPGDVQVKRLALETFFDSAEFSQDFVGLCQAYSVDDKKIELLKRGILKAITLRMNQVIGDQDYIEKQERDDMAAIVEIVQAAVIGWEHITDDATGEMIAFNSNLLRKWLEEGGELFVWFSRKLQPIFRDFDTLLDQQKASVQKN